MKVQLVDAPGAKVVSLHVASRVFPFPTSPLPNSGRTVAVSILTAAAVGLVTTTKPDILLVIESVRDQLTLNGSVWLSEYLMEVCQVA